MRLIVGLVAAALLAGCGGEAKKFCVGCFTDQYPIPLMDFEKNKDLRPTCC